MPNDDQNTTDETEAKTPDGGGFAAPICSASGFSTEGDGNNGNTGKRRAVCKCGWVSDWYQNYNDDKWTTLSRWFSFHKCLKPNNRWAVFAILPNGLTDRQTLPQIDEALKEVGRAFESGAAVVQIIRQPNTASDLSRHE